MTDVTVIGDGPTGLSAALFLAKNDADVEVFGDNETKLHSAYLYNYLGIEEMHGSDFAELAREQCKEFGANLHEERIDSVEKSGESFTATTKSGDEYSSNYLVLATGFDRELAESLGVATYGEDDAIDVDKNGRTSVDNVYSGGWATRPDKIQVAISVGDGAAIALDILSEMKGEAFHDFDVP